MEEPTRPAVIRLGALARVTGAYVFRDVDVLTHPEGEAANQRPRLRSSEVVPKTSIVALVEHLRLQAAGGGYAEAVCLALPAPIQKSATNQERPAFRCAGGDADGRSMTIDQFAESRSAAHDGPEEFVDSCPFRR